VLTSHARLQMTHRNRTRRWRLLVVAFASDTRLSWHC